MSDQVMIMFGVGVIGGIFVFLLWVLLFRSLNRQPASSPAPVLNFSELAIMFQTMRGLIHEQKTLARDFNRSVDRKITLVREVVKLVVDEHERLAGIHEDLSRKLDEARQDLAAIQRQLALHVQTIGDQPFMPPDPIPFKPLRAATEDMPALHALANTDPESAEDLIDNWVGLDFEEADAEPAEVMAAVPESPEETEAQREAMQDLLNMGERPDVGDPPPDGFAVIEMDDGNDRDRLATVRARAYKFHDAGMSITQIAQELGIGKGEVRLMLNLREKAE